MSLSRRLLFASAVWEVARPRTALTAGHLLIRLSNPAVAFDLRSASDWLVCHRAAREALGEVLDARTCTVVFAHQWHPIGAAIGEPEVESSTPTFHLFGRWDGETASPGEQFRLPAHRRIPVPAEELARYDDGFRAALRRSAKELGKTAPAAEDWGREGAPLPAIRSWSPRVKAGIHHTVLSPEALEPESPPSGHSPGTFSVSAPALLAMAAELQVLTGRRGVSGLSCVVPDSGSGPLEVHALGRAAGEPVNPMERLLELPKVSQALL
ncbi:hypothetical protein F8G81_17740 [Arthrobacter sp. CDRTa11]|uniref:hypothetical protein n=1 Tax=Arthrobacter sp. CDRTa11 TaxID=2651199 RepID=UPI002265862E|nr:hypothetical protein [Arthrobacter sp. CDRTa11]UZX04244.1 hypothetical protein F8G81_17740 [Arthrobacter sp. CDRTa11]